MPNVNQILRTIRATLGALATVLVVVATAAAGCTGTIEGTFRGADTSLVNGDERGGDTDSDPVRYLDGTAGTAFQLGLLRMIDPCALLDPAAAAGITGATPDQLVPGSSPAECWLVMVDDRDMPVWDVRVAVGVPFNQEVRDGRAPEHIGDVDIYEETSAVGECRMTMPLGSDFGLELSVMPWAPSPTIAPCDLARQYLEATRERWSPPPHRADNLTSPVFPVAGIDPCSLTGAVVTALGPDITHAVANPREVYGCAVIPTDHDGTGTGTELLQQPSIHIEFEITQPPTPIPGTDPITVDGRNGTAFELDGCTITVPVDRDDDQIVINAGGSQRLQVLSVYAPNCDDAEAVTAVAIADITTR